MKCDCYQGYETFRVAYNDFGEKTEDTKILCKKCDGTGVHIDPTDFDITVSDRTFCCKCGERYEKSSIFLE
jgi:hypothetical protein